MRTLRTTSSILLFFLSSTAPSSAQGLLGKTSYEAQDGGAHADLAQEHMRIFDARSQLLRIPNKSQPPCALEIGKSFSADTKSQGLEVISHFRTEEEVIAVVAKVVNDEAVQIDAKIKEFHKLFENHKQVFLVHYPVNKLEAARDFDLYQYVPLFAKLGELPGLALRPRDGKFVLATQQSDLERIQPQRNKNLYAGKVSFEDYKTKLYPAFRLRELEYFTKTDLETIKNGIENLGKVDKNFKSIFKSKLKSLEEETKACKKILSENSRR